jgi:hypothetical protein
MMISLMQWLRVGGIAAVLLASSGCGGSRIELPLGEVEGVVTLDGQPFSGALVEFNPQSEPPSPDQSQKKSSRPRFGGSVAVTGPDGKYALQFDNRRKGAIVGVHSIKVREIPNHNDSRPNSERSKRNYSLKGTTVVEVTKGKNTCNFELVTNDVNVVTR